MPKVTLMPHQTKAVENLDNGKILVGKVGSGKSITAAAYYAQKESPRDVFVITTAKKRDSADWETEFAKFGIGKYQDATLGGVLTVDSWNNIGKYTDIHHAFFIFDEQRLVGNGAWVNAFLHIAKSNRWIMLSATPGDTWLDYIPVFLANGFYKNRTLFKREHVVYNTFTKFPKVERYTGVAKLVKYRNRILVEMPFEMPTNRIQETIKVDFDPEMFEKVVKHRWHVYEERPLRNVAELFYVMRRVVNSDPSRLDAVTALMNRHAKLIVFYNFNYELEMLRTLVDCSEKSGRLMSNSNRESPDGDTSNVETLPSRSTDTESGSSEMESVSAKDGSRAGQTSRVISATAGGLEWNSDQSGDPSTEISESCTFGSLSPVKSDSRSSRSSENSSESRMPTSCDAENGFRPHSPTSSLDTGSFAVAEWNGHRHDPIPETDRWVYLVQYTAGAEGWNCIETNAMVFFSLTYSYKHWHQAHGRIDRLNTPFKDLYYYVLRSNSWIDVAVWKALTAKKSFNENQFRSKFSDIEN